MCRRCISGLQVEKSGVWDGFLEPISHSNNRAFYHHCSSVYLKQVLHYRFNKQPRMLMVLRLTNSPTHHDLRLVRVVGSSSWSVVGLNRVPQGNHSTDRVEVGMLHCLFRREPFLMVISARKYHSIHAYHMRKSSTSTGDLESLLHHVKPNAGSHA